MKYLNICNNKLTYFLKSFVSITIEMSDSFFVKLKKISLPSYSLLI